MWVPPLASPKGGPAWSGLFKMCFKDNEGVEEGGSIQPQCFISAPPAEKAQSARSVGELRESEDWSPLLLLRRWALEQDSEGGDGLSGSSMLG